MNLSPSDRGRPPATRVLAEPLPSGHLSLCLPLTRREQVQAKLTFLVFQKPFFKFYFIINIVLNAFFH